MPNVDSKEWDAAYKAYLSGNKKKRYPGKSYQLTNKQSPRKPKPITVKGGKERWLATQRDYLRWRKTEHFLKWKGKQFLKQGGTCYYCDLPIYGGVRDNVEHVLAKSRGGTNSPSNLVLACSSCNKDKGTKVLSAKTKEALRLKNKKKRGTYTQNIQQMPSEMHLAMRLKEMFRED